MYREYPQVFVADDSDVVWRYMDFARLVTMLRTQSLHFTQPHRFPDPYEGSLPKRNHDAWNAYAQDRANHGWVSPANLCRAMGVNCWQQGDHESEAMWKLYLRGGSGIAIRSSVGRLKRSFDDSPDVFVNIGRVRYLDYETDELEPELANASLEHFPPSLFFNAYTPLLCKRKSFEHEREIRIVATRGYMRDTAAGYEEGVFAEEWPEDGLDLPVNLEVLVDEIRVAPTQPQWFVDSVVDVVSQYEVDMTVVTSHLDLPPRW